LQTPIVNIISTIVDKVSVAMLTQLQAIDTNYTGVRYDYGHPSDIVGNLASLSRTQLNRYKALPLIGLFLDIPEDRKTPPNIATTARLSMFICCATDPRYTPQERTQQTFVPILIPIYEELMKQLLKSQFIVKPENLKIPHSYIMRYQWGKGGLQYYDNGKANIFNDYIDAIEITDLELNFKPNC
jgi:hypothetical protein